MQTLNDDDELRASLIAAIACKRLLHFPAADTGSEQGAAVALMNRLHHAGEIDAIGALLDPGANWDWSLTWSSEQRLLTAVLPSLSSPVGRMMAYIDALTSPVGMHTIDEAFLLWCEARPERVAEVLAMVEEGAAVSDRFVLGSLIAGQRSDPEHYVRVSASIALGIRPGGRNIGARALGLMPATNGPVLANALQALRSIVADPGTEGSLLADALSSALDLVARAPNLTSAPVVELIVMARLNQSDLVADVCAQAFGQHAARLAPDVVDAMTQSWSKLDANRSVPINAVAMGIYQLLQTPDGTERSLGILERILRGDAGLEIFGKLASVRHELRTGNPARFSSVIVRWLLSGEGALCEAAATLVQETYGQDVSLAVPPDQPSMSDAQALFLARKAIGWLFISPAAITSLTLSLLQHVTPAGAEDLTDLIYDPLLMNYPGSVKPKLQSALSTASESSHEALGRTLARYDIYIRDIEAARDIPELQQSDRNRRIERQRQDDQFQVARKAAEQFSVIRSIVHTSLLLHGTRSVSYGERLPDGGDPRRYDSKLGRVSVEMEHPIQWTFDPLGVEATLTAYRTERPLK